MNVLLRHARDQAKLTQEELANALGTTSISVWRWENGKNRPSPYFQMIICAYFNRPPAAFGWSEASHKVKSSLLSSIRNQPHLDTACAKHISSPKVSGCQAKKDDHAPHLFR